MTNAHLYRLAARSRDHGLVIIITRITPLNGQLWVDDVRVSTWVPILGL